ncbi:MAG: TraB/GumN family protein [Desulfobacterales bacterium]|nr:MAG: TraB/GumN family protein [Desulfobacterales bacterium]
MANYQILIHKYFKAIIVIFIFGFFFTGAKSVEVQQSPAQDTSKSCLWSVRSGSGTIYLLGSIHFLKSDAYPLAAAIEQAYSASQKIVFETDLEAMADPNVQKQMLELGLYPEGQRVNQNLRGDTLNSLKKKMAEMGLPMQQFAQFKPWFIALTLATVELMRLGYDPNYGIDMHFLKRAKEDGKELGFLEPVEYQINLLGKMNKGDQNSLLSQTLKEMDIVAKLAADITASWKQGDANNLDKLMNKSFEGHPNIRERLLVQRNRQWVSQIEKFIKADKNVIVIVGAGHLVGPDSVVDLLKQKRYQVKQK